MEANQILRTDVLDLLFENRNKQYGAYELRKNYSRRTIKALTITFSVVAALIVGSVFSQGNKSSSIEEPKEDVRLIALQTDEPEPIIPPEPPKPVTPPPAVKTQLFTTPILVEDDKVTEPLPDQKMLEDARIDVKTTDGIVDDGIQPVAAIPGNGDVTGIIEPKKPADEGPVTVVQVQAAFKGDWTRFLERNLRADVPVENGAPSAKHRVMIEFVVDLDGSISGVKALTSLGYGMEEEAMRVIRKAGKWTPAINNGYAVKAYRRQSITFDISASE
ncbi:MAG: TonB family protein [Chitinophagaceae bacterium]|nr:MAG: TonB family protein [Chitinophagaceae bacterium]